MKSSWNNKFNLFSQAGARLRGVECQFNKVCRFIDGWNLPRDCKLKLEQVSEEDRMVLPGLQAQYRLKPAEDYEQQVCTQLSFNEWLTLKTTYSRNSLRRLIYLYQLHVDNNQLIVYKP